MSQRMGSYCVRIGVVLSACLASLLIRVDAAAPADIGLADVLFDFQTKVILANAPADIDYMWVDCRILDRDGRVPANAAGGLRFVLARGVPYGSGKGVRLHDSRVQVRVKGHLFGDEGRVRELMDRWNCYVRTFVRKDGSSFAPPAGFARNIQRIAEKHIMAGLAIAKSGKQGHVVIDTAINDVPSITYSFPAQ